MKPVRSETLRLAKACTHGGAHPRARWRVGGGGAMILEAGLGRFLRAPVMATTLLAGGAGQDGLSAMLALSHHDTPLFSREGGLPLTHQDPLLILRLG